MSVWKNKMILNLVGEFFFFLRGYIEENNSKFKLLLEGRKEK